MTCKTSTTPGPALNFELPKGEVIESNANWIWMEWDHACEDMDDQAEWAVSHPMVNARAEVSRLDCASVREQTSVR